MESDGGDHQAIGTAGDSDRDGGAAAADTGDAAGARSAVAPGAVITPAALPARHQPERAPSHSASEHAHAGAQQSTGHTDDAAASAAAPLRSHRPPDADGHSGLHELCQRLAAL